jgi:hypothetical protein
VDPSFSPISDRTGEIWESVRYEEMIATKECGFGEGAVHRLSPASPEYNVPYLGRDTDARQMPDADVRNYERESFEYCNGEKSVILRIEMRSERK